MPPADTSDMSVSQSTNERRSVSAPMESPWCHRQRRDPSAHRKISGSGRGSDRSKAQITVCTNRPSRCRLFWLGIIWLGLTGASQGQSRDARRITQRQAAGRLTTIRITVDGSRSLRNSAAPRLRRFIAVLASAIRRPRLPFRHSLLTSMLAALILDTFEVVFLGHISVPFVRSGWSLNEMPISDEVSRTIRTGVDFAALRLTPFREMPKRSRLSSLRDRFSQSPSSKLQATSAQHPRVPLRHPHPEVAPGGKR